MMETIIEDERWRKALPEADGLALSCFNAAAALEPKLEGDVALLLTGDAALRKLNARFRNKDKPTNVLAFPSGDPGAFIGDVALAFESCVREANEKKITLRDHAAHLIVHGMLHLVGYDHQTESEADAMERREAAILETLGVSTPYTDAVENI